MISSFLAGCLAFFVAVCSVARAQPSPDVQRRISAAIEATTHVPIIDYTAFVNPFIGTGTFLSSITTCLDLNHIKLVSDNFGDVWSVSSSQRGSHIPDRRPLPGAAQERRCLSAWYIVGCYVHR
jgi:hypothetical protein